MALTTCEREKNSKLLEEELGWHAMLRGRWQLIPGLLATAKPHTQHGLLRCRSEELMNLRLFCCVSKRVVSANCEQQFYIQSTTEARVLDSDTVVWGWEKSALQFSSAVHREAGEPELPYGNNHWVCTSHRTFFSKLAGLSGSF